jgi:tRNA U34 5-methylaminomethyl-2-thiouridine-forming methyltransferase MnmC
VNPTPPPALPPVASIPLPGNDKKGGVLDDVTKKLPKLPKPPKPR